MSSFPPRFQAHIVGECPGSTFALLVSPTTTSNDLVSLRPSIVSISWLECSVWRDYLPVLIAQIIVKVAGPVSLSGEMA